MGLCQTKRLWSAKETINEMERQPMEWEKVLMNYISDKGLTSKTYKKLSQLSS